MRSSNPDDYIMGNETFLSKGGHAGETKPVSISSVETSLASTVHAAGLGISMSTDFMITEVSEHGQCYGHAKVGDKLVGCDFQLLSELGISTVEDFKTYMIDRQAMDTYLHFNVLPKLKPVLLAEKPKPPPKQTAWWWFVVVGFLMIGIAMTMVYCIPHDGHGHCSSSGTRSPTPAPTPSPTASPTFAVVKELTVGTADAVDVETKLCVGKTVTWSAGMSSAHTDNLATIAKVSAADVEIVKVTAANCASTRRQLQTQVLAPGVGLSGTGFDVKTRLITNSMEASTEVRNKIEAAVLDKSLQEGLAKAEAFVKAGATTVQISGQAVLTIEKPSFTPDPTKAPTQSPTKAPTSAPTKAPTHPLHTYRALVRWQLGGGDGCTPDKNAPFGPGDLPADTSLVQHILMSGSYGTGFKHSNPRSSPLDSARQSRWYKGGDSSHPSDGKGNYGDVDMWGEGTYVGCQFGGVEYSKAGVCDPDLAYPPCPSGGNRGQPADAGLCGGKPFCSYGFMPRLWLNGVYDKAWENCTEPPGMDEAARKASGAGPIIAKACYDAHQSSQFNKYGLTGRNMDQEKLDSACFDMPLEEGSDRTKVIKKDPDCKRKIWHVPAKKIFQLADTDRIVVEEITLAIDPGDANDPTLKSLYMVRCPSGQGCSAFGSQMDPKKEENMVTYEDVMSNPTNKTRRRTRWAKKCGSWRMR